MSDPSSQPSDKPALRHMMEARRRAAFVQNPNAPLALRDHFLKTITLPPASVIAGYNARGSEIDPALLLEALRAAGHTIALPVMTGSHKPLIFRLHDPDEGLIRNTYGIHEPNPEAAVVEPDILLIPLMAFDRHGGRLGTGGGYYDRTLQKLRQIRAITAIGLGFSCQELAEVPTESHDAPLDRIATELQVFDPASVQ